MPLYRNGIETEYDAVRLRTARKTVAFDGTSGNGAQGSVTVFTVTGEVLVATIVHYCTENLEGASATISSGVTGSTSLFVVNPTGGAPDIDANEFWIDATPDAYGVALDAKQKDIVIDQDVILTIGTADITDGTLEITCHWMPISTDGNVVAA